MAHKTKIVRGDERQKKMLQYPDTGQKVAAIRNEMSEVDRTYAANIALVRSAANLTQAELASRLGVGQAAVSKIERQRDWLLSTFASYIRAAGAEQARIVVTIGGDEVEFDLNRLVDGRSG